MKVHFIAIGGSAMHNLAIALHRAGHEVSGSDDEIFEPSCTRLANLGLLPEKDGWFPDKLDAKPDMVILGMHARADNPELIRAQELELKVVSYPEFLFHMFKDKKRVVIGGSHGKTSITGMILHVLQELKMPADFMVGAQLPGFDCMVQISDAPIAIIEGDEYLSSPIDRRPKFHWYKPQIAVLSGVAWDHINVFPTFDNYVEQFAIFTQTMPNQAQLFYFGDDQHLEKIARAESNRLLTSSYKAHPHHIENGITYLKTNAGSIPVAIFGDHNMQNLNAALQVCRALGVRDENFYTAIQSFSGAARRLEKLSETDSSIIFRDFAHAPSKLKATVAAMVAQFPKRKLVACMELHTFSSLTKEFLKEYQNSMNGPETAIVYFNPKVISHKKLEPISEKDVQNAFNRPDLVVVTSAKELQLKLQEYSWHNQNLILMSSGNFDGMDVVSFAKALHKKVTPK